LWRLKTRCWACWRPTADLAGRTLRPTPTLGINETSWRCRRTAPLSILASSRGRSPLRFDLRARKLSGDPPADQQTSPAKQAGLAVERWRDDFFPTLDGKPIQLRRYERALSLAIAPDNSRFVLGADYSLRGFDAKGGPIWRRDTPATPWAVNITADGRLVIAACSDGTIRWHRMDDGRELLALYVLADKQNWVAWTPEASTALPQAPSVCCNGK